MSTHNIYFPGEITEILELFVGKKKVFYLELCFVEFPPSLTRETTFVTTV